MHSWDADGLDEFQSAEEEGEKDAGAVAHVDEFAVTVHSGHRPLSAAKRGEPPSHVGGRVAAAVRGVAAAAARAMPGITTSSADDPATARELIGGMLGNTSPETGPKGTQVPAHAMAAEAPPAVLPFIASAEFAGTRPGYVFKTGSQGLGYYRDAPRPRLQSAREWLDGPFGQGTAIDCSDDMGGGERDHDRAQSAFEENAAEEEAMRQLVQQALEQARVLKEEGNCHFKNEQLRSATSKYRAATRKLARFSLRRLPFGCDEMVQLLVSCHLNMALCMLKLGEASKAVANCDRVLELDPVNTKANYRGGKAHVELKNWSDARAMLSNIPRDKRTKDALALLRTCKENIQQQQVQHKQFARAMFRADAD